MNYFKIGEILLCIIAILFFILTGALMANGRIILSLLTIAVGIFAIGGVIK